MILAECGHEVGSVSQLHEVKMKAVNPDDTPTVDAKVLCPECYDYVIHSGLALRSRKEEYEWLYPANEDLLSMAKRLSISHTDPEVMEFASLVIQHMTTNSQGNVTCYIDTANDFTLHINGSNITGVGKIRFVDVEEAIEQLTLAKIVWVRPVSVYLPDGESICDDSMFSFFIRRCKEAAASISDGKPYHVLSDGQYRLTVNFEKVANV